jgi:hypothetical protein
VKMRKKWYFIAPAALVGMALFIAIGGNVVMYLWNWLTPELFGWRRIGFWQALGLLALCRILFGGFGCGGSRGRRRWDRMTPEEREKFRQGMRSRCGFEPPASGAGDPA